MKVRSETVTSTRELSTLKQAETTLYTNQVETSKELSTLKLAETTLHTNQLETSRELSTLIQVQAETTFHTYQVELTTLNQTETTLHTYQVETSRELTTTAVDWCSVMGFCCAENTWCEGTGFDAQCACLPGLTGDPSGCGFIPGGCYNNDSIIIFR